MLYHAIVVKLPFCGCVYLNEQTRQIKHHADTKTFYHLILFQTYDRYINSRTDMLLLYSAAFFPHARASPILKKERRRKRSLVVSHIKVSKSTYKRQSDWKIKTFISIRFFHFISLLFVNEIFFFFSRSVCHLLLLMCFVVESSKSNTHRFNRLNSEFGRQKRGKCFFFEYAWNHRILTIIWLLYFACRCYTLKLYYIWQRGE